jgi:ABC-type transport system involved in multi-copper enzyme maturation permease subunit
VTGKMINKSEKALICKDINEITSSKRVFIPMTIVPVVLIVIIPFAVLIGANFIGSDSSTFTKMAPLLKKLPSEYSAYTPAQLLIMVSLNFMFSSYFLIIPIMCSGVIGASSFVGEKEHKTMESLLYTPISMEQLLRAKILGVFVPSYIITFISFVVFGIIFDVGGFIYFGKLIFPDVKWLIIIFWITPAVNLLSLTFTVMVSAKSETFQEAQQVSGFLLIPVIILLVGQMTGVLLLNKAIMLAGGRILMIIDLPTYKENFLQICS